MYAAREMRASWLLIILLACARCSSSTSDGAAVDVGIGLDGGVQEDAGDASKECLVFSHIGEADALSYFVAQTYLCQCGTFADGGAAGGAPCSQASECKFYCCPCPTGPKHYAAAICNGTLSHPGTCADEATACAAALTLSDVQGVVCP
jgi:hypothetical protein